MELTYSPSLLTFLLPWQRKQTYQSVLELYSLVNCKHRLTKDTRVRQKPMNTFHVNHLAIQNWQQRALYTLLLVNCAIHILHIDNVYNKRTYISVHVWFFSQCWQHLLGGSQHPHYRFLKFRPSIIIPGSLSPIPYPYYYQNHLSDI